MRKHVHSPESRRAGFTLVELLVVIGIIALLISILLPSLNKARRAAATVKCTSNMKQVAMAVIQYSSENKGLLPIAFIPADPARTIYPDGLWWPSELVRLKYLAAPNVYPTPGGAPSFDGSSVFRCPEGVDAEDISATAAGTYPTDMYNNAYSLQNAASQQQLGFGIASWYMLQAATNTNSNKLKTNAKTSTPFMAYARNNSGVGPTGTLTDAILTGEFSNPDFRRKMTTIRRAGEMVMVVEASNWTWSYAVGTPGTPTYTAAAAAKNLVPRLGARHGKKTADGRDAYTNIAFFDGHVAGYPTLPFSTDGIMNLSAETVFFVGMSR